MKLHIKRGGGVPFARKVTYEYDGVKYESDLKNGDVITILDSGIEEEGQYGKQFNFKIKTRNGEKKLNFNQKTQNVLIEEFGDDSEKWINKDVKVIIKKDVIAGKKVDIVYLVTEGWTMDEYGELVKVGQKGEKSDIEYPTEEVDLNDIPF